MNKSEAAKPQKTTKDEVLLKREISASRDFPIVGIGASAGGLEALEQFFSHMPRESGMAFVVIQHLDPTHKGIMPELLQRTTEMPVFQATDNLKVRPDCVYVIPPNKSLSLLNGSLFLFEPLETRGLRLPVDFFFRSLANDRKEKSIGIILTGMGSDGSQGLKAIKEKNGIVLVQTPATAKFDSMPRNATEAVIADIVAPVEELPQKLINFLKFIPSIVSGLEIDDKNNSNLDKIIILLREKCGHDFSGYKKNTLFRRIERRKGLHQIEKLNNYVRFCQENPGEVEILFKELLIGVTSFFRDHAVWEKLKVSVLPELIDNLPSGYVLRAWVTACSTGEEAYTLAIVFKEVIENLKNSKNVTLQIFATDIDQDAIDQARKGVYSPSTVAELSEERISRFFSVEADGYRVNASIREMVVFAVQNLIKDPPFTRLDILTCRNMLIYMEPQLQKKLILLFNYSLNPDGIMVLGNAETFNNQREGFTEVDRKLKIFKRTYKQKVSELNDFPSSFKSKRIEQSEKQAHINPVENVQALTDQLLLQRFPLASVLVNNKGDIQYMTGHIGKYLEPVAGKANWNICTMAREGLRNELPGALRKALQSFNEVNVRNIKVGTNGGSIYVDVTVQQVESQNSINGMVLVLFTDVTEKLENVTQKTESQKSTGRLKDMKLKLQQSLENMQGLREEMQTSQEELKSTNEELQSTNEELQSTNEELTTSKEEMQSLNEELQTVNIELQSKVSDFIHANDDMKNLLNSTEIATLFLDKELRIRRFTDQTTKIFKLRPVDIGRPFTDQASDLNYPDIESHARQVLETLVSIETAMTTADGRWYNVRIMPYRTIDDHIDGLVITFTDITRSKQIETNLAVSETRYQMLFESAKDGILILDGHTGKILDINPYLTDLLGFSKIHFIQKTFWEIGLFKVIVPSKERFLEFQQRGIVRFDNLPIETADGRKIPIEFISHAFSANKEMVIQCLIHPCLNPA
ncbi:MAG: chemotaxis protein CheB [Prolixibacteraceae bacterium]